MGGMGGSANASVSGNFDPTGMLNTLRNDQWKMATYQREKELADRAYYEQKAREAANKGQGGWTGGPQTPVTSAATTRNYGFGDDADPMNKFMRTKDRLDRMNETNPAFAHGQGLIGSNSGFFNVPAAGALMGLYGSGVDFTPLVAQSQALYQAGIQANAATNQADYARQAKIQAAAMGDRS